LREISVKIFQKQHQKLKVTRVNLLKAESFKNILTPISKNILQETHKQII